MLTRIWRNWNLHPLLVGNKMGFPGDSDGKESAYKVGDLDSVPRLGRSPWESPCQRSPAGCRPWGCKESDMTEQPSSHNKTATLETSLAAPQIAYIELPCEPETLLKRYTQEKRKHVIIPSLYISDHSSVIHNNNSWNSPNVHQLMTGKQKLVYPCNRILFGDKKGSMTYRYMLKHEVP